MNGELESAPVPASGSVAAKAAVVRVQVQAERRAVWVEGLRMRVPDHKPVHEAAVHAAAVLARRSGGPRWVIAQDEAGRVRFLVHPDGHSSDVSLMGDRGPAAAPSESVTEGAGEPA